MAAIAHAFTEVNTAQTTASATPVDVPGAVIASDWSGVTLSSGTGFTADKKYLIEITAQLSSSVANDRWRCVTVHGSTEFADSVQIMPVYSAANFTGVYSFRTVWTAVSTEGIKLQFSRSAGTGTISIDKIAILAINLSDDLTENTDWFFAERSVDDTLNIAFTDGASVTFTPGTAGHDWLVMTYSQADSVNTVDSFFTRIDRSGEGASSLPDGHSDIDTSAGQPGFSLARVFNLGAASNTFKEQSASSTDTTHIRLHSSIFVLNLNKFKNHANAYDVDVPLGITNYAQIQTISITPDVSSNVWIGAYFTSDRNDAGVETEFRVQVDGADQPSGQTTANYQFEMGNSASDAFPFILSTMLNLSAAAHTIDLDASVDNTTGTPAAQDRTLWAVTMELAAAAVGESDTLMSGSSGV